MLVHPLIFRPIYKYRVWGGDRIFSLLDRGPAPAEPIGESWDLADLETDVSVVALGPAAGQSLHDLMQQWGSALMGRVGTVDGRFPLLIKYLDARQSLSVQVHPNEAVARKLGGSVRVKHEAWYILEAGPEGFIYHGLKDGVDENSFLSAMREGRPDDVLRRVRVRAGDCTYLPSGTPHALGADVVVAEVQTPSDVTYRTYDWGRTDPTTGKPRQLHLEQAVECMTFGSPPAPVWQERTHVASLWTAVTRLVSCPSFVIERVRMVEGIEQRIPYAEPVVWMVLEGQGEIQWRSGARPIPFHRGDVVLLPALMEDASVRLSAASQWLEVTVPVRSDLANYERPSGPVEGAAPTPQTVQIGLPPHRTP